MERRLSIMVLAEAAAAALLLVGCVAFQIRASDASLIFYEPFDDSFGVGSVVSEKDDYQENGETKKMAEAAEGQLPAHPYVPADLQLPGYVPLSLSTSTILSVYLISSLLIVSLVWVFSGRLKKISKVDRLLMCWWIFTGLTHMILEGYFAFSPEFYKDNTSFYLAEVWKEYSKGDSRYVFRDSGIVTIEGITAAVEGPASILAFYAIAGQKSYSYILQFAISLGQLYGTAVYFVTSILEGDNFASSPLYYYAYYVVANSFWILIPTLIAVRCWNKICAAIQNTKQVKAKRP